MYSVGVFGKNCFFNIYAVKYHKEITNVLYLIKKMWEDTFIINGKMCAYC